MKLPPHSHEAEQGILGCILLEPERMDQAAEAGVDAGWFYDLRHADLFAVVGQMVQEGQRIDLITLGNRLKAADILTRIGGLAYLSELMDTTPSPSNLPYYLDIARAKMRLRKLLKAAQAIQEQVSECDGEPEGIIAGAETAILGIRSEFGGQSDATAKQIALTAIQTLEDRISGACQKLPTGWGYLDRVLRGGLGAAQVIVIAGRPGTGKTALALSLARSVARAGHGVGFVSLEMGSGELGDRLLAQESGLDWGGYDQWNKPTNENLRTMTAAAGRFNRLPITVWDGLSINMGSLAAKARRWKAKGMRLLEVDYLQLVEGNKKVERREQVEEISRGIKTLARELQIPIVLLAQLNREIEKGGDRKPKLSDLRESGAIEQDADVVGMLYRAQKQDEFAEAQATQSVDVNLWIPKNRNGRSHIDVPFSFIPHLTLFEPKRAKPV
jgi:replicative DNA helicase